MEWTATLHDNVSGPAKAGTEALRAQREELLKYNEALTKGSVGASAAAVRPAGAKEAEQAAKRRAAAEAYVAKIRDKHFLDQQRAEERAEAKKNREAEAAAKKRFELGKGYAQKAAIAGVAGGIATGALLTPLALGYKGVAQLQALTFRAQYNLRNLFSKVDATPMVRAFDKLTSNLDRNSFMGQTLGKIFTRTFDGLFSSLERAVPYVTAFGQGMILAFLKAETYVLRARIALVPYQGLIDRIAGKFDGLSIAATAGGAALLGIGGYALYSGLKIAFLTTSMVAHSAVAAGKFVIGCFRAAAGLASMAASAAAAAAPFLAVGAAIAGVALAIDQATKLYKEWDDQSSGLIWRKLKSDIGLGESSDKERGIVSGADYDRLQAERQRAAVKPAGAEEAERAGKRTGEALAKGIVVGIGSKESELAAAGRGAVGAVEAGSKEKGEIHSPSRLMRREVGQNLGKGTVEGVKDTMPDVERAGRSLIPSAAPSGSVGRAAPTISVQVTFTGDLRGSPEEIETIVTRSIRTAMHDAAVQLGATR